MAQGQLTYYPKQEGYDALLQATNIQLDQNTQALRERNMEVAGALNLTASGRGTLKDPQGQASLTIPAARYPEAADPQRRTSRRTSPITKPTFTLASQVLNTPLRAQGKSRFDRRLQRRCEPRHSGDSVAAVAGGLCSGASCEHQRPD